MSRQEYSFPEYGFGGDCVGARRSRRAFRLCVTACVAFAGVLWMTEYFFRNDKAERLYIASVTHEFSSARSFLRAAVKIDAETRDTPTPKYIAALAEREESDRVIETYEKAIALAPKNAMLAMRFGCQLYRERRYQEARDRFRDAGMQAPHNALPGYLEAAALQRSRPPDADLAEALALIARTTSSGERVVFPKPSWPAAVLPQDGAWYAKLRRMAVDESCALLYEYTDFVIAKARSDIGNGEVRYWDSWLKTLEEMGQRVAESPDQGVTEASAGINIQLRALDVRCELRTGQSDEALVERRLKLREALAQLREFERARDDRIARDRERYAFPMWWFFGATTAALFVCYSLVYLVAKVARTGRQAWTLPHTRFAKTLLAAACVLFFLILCAAAVFQQRAPEFEEEWKLWLAWPWTTVLLIMIAFGALYPSLALPSARAAAGSAEGGDPDKMVLRSAQIARRMAGISMMRRYYGLLLGLFLCTLSVWTVLYRVFTSLYPWQLTLLTTGLSEEEARLVQDVLAMLS